MYFQGLPPHEALFEMKRLGFKDDWTLHGLKAYLQAHPTLDSGKHACEIDATAK
jgi:hypothetical protein